jgi:hypothetical protein
MMFIGSAGAQRDAAAKDTNELVGTWTPVSSSAYGANPRGILIFAPDGRYSLTLLRQSLPKFAANSRLQGTAEENQAVVHGSITHFGKYAIEDGGKTLAMNIEGSTYPNWDGATQKRPFTVSGDTLSYKVATPSAGGSAGETVWRRAK